MAAGEIAQDERHGLADRASGAVAGTEPHGETDALAPDTAATRRRSRSTHAPARPAHQERYVKRSPPDYRTSYPFLGVEKTSLEAGSPLRTRDGQLGKLIDEGPEDYDPWA